MLRGTTLIELTDVRTGKVEVIEKHNMVTNAVGDIFSYNPLGFRFGNFTPSDGVVSTDFRAYAFPIWKIPIGGLLLYGEPLKEDPNAYYADADNPLIGYSSNDVNSGTDAMRGSLNKNESGLLDDGKGYRYVFDFTTTQANGTIASIGLTSSYAGKAGHGSTHISDPTHLITSMYGNFVVADNMYLDERLRRIAAITSIDADDNIGYFARVIGAKTVEVGKVRLPLTQISLMDNINALPDVYEIRTIATTDFCEVYETDEYNYSTLIDGGDGYIWGFQHKGNIAGNFSGNATVLWIKIRKSDWSFEEGQWTIPAKLLSFGRYYTPDNKSSISSHFTNHSIIKDGALYAIEYTSDSYMRGVYKIPLDNPSDVTYFEAPAAYTYLPVVSESSWHRRVSTAVNEIGGVVSYRYMYIEGGKLKLRSSGSKNNVTTCRLGLTGVNKPGLRVGPYLLGLGIAFCTTSSNASYGANWSPSVFLPTCYLATINNLETPVTKTADKTMKITYILREE